MNSYNISFSINKSYLPFALVTLYSLLVNNKDSFFNVYILHNNCFTNESINKAISNTILNSFKNFKVHLVDMSKVVELDNLQEIGIYPKEIFFKIFLPKVLPNISKVLHLDTDVICRKPINNFYTTDMSNYLFLGDNFSITSTYLNVGVCLINLELARTENITNKLFNYIQNNNSLEEFAINKLFHSKILFANKGDILTTQLCKREYPVPIYNNTTIFIHYTANKPYYIERTQLHYNTLTIKEYFKYLQPFIKNNYFFRYKVLILYINTIGIIFNSYYRRITYQLHKLFPTKKISYRNKFIFNKIIKYMGF